MIVINDLHDRYSNTYSSPSSPPPSSNKNIIGVLWSYCFNIFWTFQLERSISEGFPCYRSFQIKPYMAHLWPTDWSIYLKIQKRLSLCSCTSLRAVYGCSGFSSISSCLTSLSVWERQPMFCITEMHTIQKRCCIHHPWCHRGRAGHEVAKEIKRGKSSMAAEKWWNLYE